MVTPSNDEVHLKVGPRQKLLSLELVGIRRGQVEVQMQHHGEVAAEDDITNIVYFATLRRAEAASDELRQQL
eukprot:CAMPEP_0183476846 /NCGR_PEP_ID=MMETSP0370-20130417/167132_1 /TAXON_ID=268820 /ORGANISM="Peridinium aciculiferum, Strain PAER-2" /LENGTH=71 /DNA_ID=CAMNT_0025669721 /DNA_START=15 /DNA_END=230 /DNA_ORIENTATION=-